MNNFSPLMQTVVFSLSFQAEVYICFANIGHHHKTSPQAGKPDKCFWVRLIADSIGPRIQELCWLHKVLKCNGRHNGRILFVKCTGKILIFTCQVFEMYSICEYIILRLRQPVIWTVYFLGSVQIPGKEPMSIKYCFGILISFHYMRLKSWA